MRVSAFSSFFPLRQAYLQPADKGLTTLMMHVYVKIEINEREEKRPSTNEKTCPSSAFVGGNLSYCY